MRRITFAFDPDGNGSLFDIGQIGHGQPDVGPTEILLQTMALGRARNRNNPRLACEHAMPAQSARV